MSISKKNKIIIFGRNDISRKCYLFLSKKYNKKFIIKYYKKNLKINDCLIGFSIKYNKKISKNVINKFKLGIINFHNGDLPYFKGLYSIHHTIRLKSKLKIKNFFITAHFIDEKFDSGPIISKKKIKLAFNETAFSLYKKSNIAMYNFFKKLSKMLINQKFILKKKFFKNTKSMYFDKKSLINEINLNQDIKQIEDHIKSLIFPGKKLPFFKISNKKYYIKYVK